MTHARRMEVSKAVTEAKASARRRRSSGGGGETRRPFDAGERVADDGDE